MNVQRSRILQLTVYKFELDHNAAETNENICWTKENKIDYTTVTKLL